MVEQRRFRRVKTNFIVRVRGRKAGSDELAEFESKAANMSLGGVFVRTPTPFSKDTMVELDLAVPGPLKKVRARGIVRWSAPEGNMPGMGIEFSEVSALDMNVVTSYVGDRIAQEGISQVTSTKLHKRILKFYHRNIGETFTVNSVAQFFSVPDDTVVGVLRDFQENGLARVVGKTVIFMPAPEAKLKTSIENWVKLSED